MRTPGRREGASNSVPSALRVARRAWQLQYRDSARSIRLADQALARALNSRDVQAEGWARLVRGFHQMRYSSPAEAARELAEAQRCFEVGAQREGHILAAVGIARCDWMQGRYRDSLARLLPLRDEGMRVLKHEARGMLLNGIAGCYSAQGDSAQAFAYMYEALRESRPARGHGFDVVLFCNLGHELYQLGDYDEALAYLHEGIDRCAQLANARLKSVLLINRIVCLTDLGRPQEAMDDIAWLLAAPADASGRGVQGAAFETMAIAALRAGRLALGAELVGRAQQAMTSSGVADPQVELVVAEAELMIARGEWQKAAVHLEASQPLAEEGLRPPGRPKGESPSAQHEGSQISARVRCLFFEVLAVVQEHLGASAPALLSLRRWQQLHVERARRASLARQQAASLKTELMRLERERDLIEQRRRDSERAKGALQAINQQLSQKIAEVEALRVALQRQAVRDFLTGLFNRRHLNDVLPSMLALAQREQQPLALAIIDLDHFKAINDQHGHLMGDRLLAGFGRLLERRLRKSDIACRYGGEEFCVLMPRTTAQAASRKLGSLLRAWRSEVFTHEDRVLAGNCFSAGVADSLQAPQSTDALLRAADQCVLQAKRLGRNRVIAYEPEVKAPP